MYVPSCARNNFQGYKRHGQETIAATHCGWDGVQSSVPHPCPSRLDGHGCGGTVAYLRLGGRWASALPAANFSAFVAFGLLSVLPAFLPALRPVAIISPPFMVCYSPDHSWAYAYTVRCAYRWSNSPNGPLSVHTGAAQGLVAAGHPIVAQHVAVVPQALDDSRRVCRHASLLLVNLISYS